jgi:UDP-N-acetylmuramoyl-L-alanyl-D-glutamate--2,6-diaminopimelate ligase
LDCSEPSSVLQEKIVSGLSSDSRGVSEHEVFFAITGAVFDAKQVVSEVLTRNVAAVVYEGDTPPNINKEAPLIKVRDVREALAYAAHKFFEQPSYRSTNVAITGTSGKTSVSWFLSHALHALKQKTFLGGTLGYSILVEGKNPATELIELGNTSIDPISVQRLLKQAVEDGAVASVFEATSQGVVQNRMRYIAWNGAVFTNLSRDHLDLHDTMEEYEEAKARLFVNDLNSSPKEQLFAIINGDDPAGARLANRIRRQCPRIKLVVFSREQASADAMIKDVVATQTGISFSIVVDDQTISIKSSSIGTHSAYNLSCAALVLFQLGYRVEEISQALSEVPPVPGRLEYIPGGKVPVYIDYAHKPDALLKILQFLKPLVHDGRLICVFGCGGDRDAGKRSIMGEIAVGYADVPVVTSDNPRTEDPEEIIEAILEGIPQVSRSTTVVEVDRRKAIEKAIAMATPGDVVLIAGKGHEPYQEIQGVKYPFHDAEVVKAYM